MRKFLILIFSFFLVSCDGFDINSTDNLSEDSDQVFTRPELAFNVLFSSLILNDSGFNNREGFVVLFDDTANLTEIELRTNDDDSALIGTYPWTISNDKLQVTYPNSVVCTSTKTSETASQYRATSSCSGGEPANSQIRNTLIIPSNLDVDDLSGESFTVDNENDDFRLEFFIGGALEIVDIDSDGDEIPSTRVIGEYTDSMVFTNKVVRLDLPTTDEHRLLFRLNGSLNSGLLMDLRFTTSSNTLKSVYIYNTGENDNWDTESVYDDIRFD